MPAPTFGNSSSTPGIDLSIIYLFIYFNLFNVDVLLFYNLLYCVCTGWLDVTEVKRQGRPKSSLRTLSHLQVEWQATLVTFGGSQIHFV